MPGINDLETTTTTEEVQTQGTNGTGKNVPNLEAVPQQAAIFYGLQTAIEAAIERGEGNIEPDAEVLRIII